MSTFFHTSTKDHQKITTECHPTKVHPTKVHRRSGFPSKGNSAVKKQHGNPMKRYSGWWLSHLPLVGNILLIYIYIWLMIAWLLYGFHDG